MLFFSRLNVLSGYKKLKINSLELFFAFILLHYFFLRQDYCNTPATIWAFFGGGGPFKVYKISGSNNFIFGVTSSMSHGCHT
jgi:hypothetical protein